MNTKQEAIDSAAKAIVEANIQMRCLVTRSPHGAYGFRFDPGRNHAQGDLIDCGVDGKHEVVHVMGHEPELEPLEY